MYHSNGGNSTNTMPPQHTRVRAHDRLFGPSRIGQDSNGRSDPYTTDGHPCEPNSPIPQPKTAVPSTTTANRAPIANSPASQPRRALLPACLPALSSLLGSPLARASFSPSRNVQSTHTRPAPPRPRAPSPPPPRTAGRARLGKIEIETSGGRSPPLYPTHASSPAPAKLLRLGASLPALSVRRGKRGRRRRGSRAASMCRLRGQVR
jgi:hypothetical protein